MHTTVALETISWTSPVRVWKPAAPTTLPRVGNSPSEVSNSVKATRFSTSTPLPTTPERTAIIICGPPSAIHTPLAKERPGAPMRTILRPSLTQLTPQPSMSSTCSCMTGSDLATSGWFTSGPPKARIHASSSSPGM